MTAAIILGLLIPALFLFGGQLAGSWNNLAAGMAERHAAAKVVGVTALGSATGPALTGSVTLTTAKGTVITLDGALIQPLGQSIATLGANGTTTLLADNLAQLAKKLRDSDEITQAQFNILTKLANQGHDIAEIAGVVEQAVKQYPTANAQEFFSAKVLLDGKLTTMKNVLDVNGYYTDNNIAKGYRYNPATGEMYNTLPADLLNPSNAPDGQSLNTLLKLYQQADSSGALLDPAIKQVVSSLTTQIALTLESLEQAEGDVFMGHSEPEQIQSIAASTAIHIDSSGICETGNATDSGVHCSP
jgi:hypothetical protein